MAQGLRALLPEDLTPSSAYGLWEHQAHMCYTDTCLYMYAYMYV